MDTKTPAGSRGMPGGTPARPSRGEASRSQLRKVAAVLDSKEAIERREPVGGTEAGRSYKVKGLPMRLVPGGLRCEELAFEKTHS